MLPDRLPNSVKREEATTKHILRGLSQDDLPPSLQALVPDCSQNCLNTYIDQEYQCPFDGSGCLCEQYSNQGFTLGELAYICLTQDCEPTSESVSLAQYQICSAIPGAVAPTHSVLTVPPTTSSQPHTSTTTKTSSRFKTTTVISTETSHHHGTTSHPHTTSKPAVASAATARTGHSVSHTTSMSSVVPDASSVSRPSSTHHTALTSGETAGIIIGCIAAALLIAAIIYFFACFRRRKKQREAAYNGDEKHESYDFVDEAPPHLSPFRDSFIQPALITPRLRTDSPQTVPKQNATDTRDTLRYWQQLGGGQNTRTAPNDRPSEESTQSDESKRTLSRLLPKPRDQMVPMIIPSKPRSGSDDSTASTFEEHRSHPIPKVTISGLPPNPRSKLHSPRKIPPQMTVPPKPSNQKVPPQLGLPANPSPPRTAPQGSLSLKIPVEARRAPGIPPPAPVAFPPTRGRLENPTDTVRRESSASKSLSRDSSGSLLNYYASAEAGRDVPPDFAEYSNPSDQEIPKRKPVPSLSRGSRLYSSSRAQRSDSEVSDTNTTFDESSDTDMDEPSPPESSDKVLSPVEESPILRSPIADIRYPKVPKSANQSEARMSDALPRTPDFSPNEPEFPFPYLPQKQQQEWPLQNVVTPPDSHRRNSSSLSGSTLAAKRRGDDIAAELEMKLNLADSLYSPFQHHLAKLPPAGTEPRAYESPLKGYGRVASNNGRTSRQRGGSNARRLASRSEQAPEVVAGSPRWEPKLTPERRGEDLYLQVGVATPMRGEFRR